MRLHVVTAGPRPLSAGDYQRMYEAGLISAEQIEREVAPRCPKCLLSTLSRTHLETCPQDEKRPLRAAPAPQQPWDVAA